MPQFISRFTAVFGVLLPALLVLCGANAGAALPVRTVLFATGSDVPGGGATGSGVPSGAKFAAFSGYVEDGEGHSAFIGTWTSPTGRGTGLFHNGAAIAVVGGTASTGTADGALFASFGQPLVSPAGVAFSATLRGPRVNPRLLRSIWSNTRDGNLHPYLNRTDAPPDAPTGLIDTVLSFSLRDDELVALVNYAVGRGGVTLGTRTALIVSSPTRYETLLRTGQQLDVQNAPRITRITAFMPAPLSPGQDRTHASGVATAQVLLNDGRKANIAAYSATSRSLLGSTELESPYVALGLPSVAATSVAGFEAYRRRNASVTAANDEVVVAGNADFGLNAVAFEGDMATGAFKIGAFTDPIFNDQAAYAFSALLTGVDLSSANNRALLFSGGSAIAAVARLDDLVPDGEGERRFDVRYRAFLALGLPDGLNAGPVWMARLSGPNVAARNNLALFAQDSAGVKRRLLRNEDMLDLGGGMMKTVSTFAALSGGTFPIGGRRAYGQAGTLGVQVTFTDCTTGLVRITY